MILATGSFVILTLCAALGIAGQWSALVGADSWRLLAAGWIVALVVDGVTAGRQRLDVRRELPARGYLGRAVGSRLVLGNPASRTLELELAAHAGPGLEGTALHERCRVPAGGEHASARPVIPVQLGALALAPLDARLLGRLRLAWWRRRLHAPAQILIVPDRLAPAGQSAGSTASGRHRRPLPGPGRELFGQRAYRRGNPLSAMDWKATARRGAPVVRIHEADEHLSLVIVVDTGRGAAVRFGPLSRLGHHVNVAARLAEDAIGRGDHVALVVYADSPLAVVPLVHGHRGLLRIREALAGAAATGLESNPVAAALRVRRLVRQRALVLMLTGLDAGAADEHLLRATTLLARNHLPVVAGLVDADALAMRWQAGGNWQAPYRMLAAMELARVVEVGCSRLRRSGARVVRALPGELDARVRADYAQLRARHGV